MNFFSAIDNKTAAEMEHLAPHKNMIDINEPRTLSKAASLPKPAVSTIANWLSYPRTLTHDPVKQAFLESLAQ